MNKTESSNSLEFTGIYGKYSITAKDKEEVRLYRISLLLCSFSFTIGLAHWIFLGSSFAWVWLIPMAISLGGCLKWIHIYLQFIHKILLILWGIGCLGIVAMVFTVGPGNALHTLSINRTWLIAIGPFFASLTGIGFKEFFCFRRLEAIGATLLIPIALTGHITHLINQNIVMLFLLISSILLFIMSVKKFGVDASADIGDKSVFDYLERERVSASA